MSFSCTHSAPIAIQAAPGFGVSDVTADFDRPFGRSASPASPSRIVGGMVPPRSRAESPAPQVISLTSLLDQLRDAPQAEQLPLVNQCLETIRDYPPRLQQDMLRTVWHHLPLFSETNEVTARVMLSAANQQARSQRRVGKLDAEIDAFGNAVIRARAVGSPAQQTRALAQGCKRLSDLQPENRAWGASLLLNDIHRLPESLRRLPLEAMQAQLGQLPLADRGALRAHLEMSLADCMPEPATTAP